ncbi:MAG: hypothetical protein LBV17_11160 [Treponema sp.]|jgi:hypothetical protein|nr:hypothetical protein [Treponema sp.]
MKKFYSLFLLLILIVLSCKGTPKPDEKDSDPGLSQLDLTAEEDQDGDAEIYEEGAIAQDETTDGSDNAESVSAVMDELQADATVEEQPLIEETSLVEGEKPQTAPLSPPLPVSPPPPRVTAVPPPKVPVEETPAVTEPETEQPAQEESAPEQKPPSRSQPWIAPPPAVSAVKDDAPIPNQRVLVPQKPEKDEEIVFSRTVRATAGQIVEIPFRGTGWVYLGELASRRGIVYNSRRLDPEGQSFIFTAETAGTYALKFYRQDFIRDYILNDYVQVIVGEPPNAGGAGWFNPPVDRGRVTAEPRWPSAPDESAILRGGQAGANSSAEKKNGSSQSSANAQGASNAPSTASVVVIVPPVQGTGIAPSVEETVITPQAMPQTQPQTASQAQQQTATPQTGTPEIPQSGTEMPSVEKQEKLPPEEILKKAQDSFNEGNTSAAIALLDQYTEYYPNGSDELYWLYGQFYEANTPNRNILLSLDYYRRLINEYPQSRRYNDARRRTAYLERFYVNIQ